MNIIENILVQIQGI